ncbi:hypothetical protein PESP_a2620 [Pseudoalteromonas espejiana DSM 9414]|nr:hypothetical protein PESP_a2620 [Pseudoalteromonas espejiana DSM 9414]
MDLLFANIITAVFFIVGHNVIRKVIFNKLFTVLEIVGYSFLIFCGLVISATLFAATLSFIFPEIYPFTFTYKALFICPLISIYFLYRMLQNKRRFNVRT